MGTLKNCHSPAGMHYSTAGVKLTNLTDCPACKHGTLDKQEDGKLKCADCGKEFSEPMPATEPTTSITFDQAIKAHIKLLDEAYARLKALCLEPKVLNEECSEMKADWNRLHEISTRIFKLKEVIYETNKMIGGQS